MPVYNISPSPIPTSSASDSASVGVKTPEEKTLDDIVGNVRTFEYSVTGFCAGLSKIVRTKTKERYFFTPYKKSADEFKYDERLSQSISRTRRVILELALCNDWKWFATFTVAADKEDRYSLEKFYKHFKENWLRYQREKTGKNIPFLIVPEKHKDGAWHLHGFFSSDIDDQLVSFYELDQAGFRYPNGKRLPLGLIRGGYFDWPAYRKRFGFCSFDTIKSKIHCSFYITKYITKALASMPELQGKQLYRCSEGLQRAVLYGRVYGNTPELDAVITRDYEFCSTGWYQYEPEIGFNPLLDIIEQWGEFNDFMDCRAFDLLGETDGKYLPIPNNIEDYPPDVQAEVDAYYEVTQLAIKGFEEKTVKNTVSKGSARL